MSFAADQIQRIDAQLDRLHVHAHSSLSSIELDYSASSTAKEVPARSPRTGSLQAAIKALSIDTSSSRPLLSARSLRSYLKDANLQPSQAAQTSSASSSASYEHELEWLLVSKAVTQTYGLALDRLLNQTVSMATDLAYWDEVLARWRYTVLYSIQTSPLRLWAFGSAVWDDARRRAAQFDIAEAAQKPLTQRWHDFYALVRQGIHERGALLDIQASAALAPASRIRAEIRAKQSRLRHARLRGANALGILLGEGLLNEVVHGDGLATPKEEGVSASSNDKAKWKRSMARNVALIDAVLARVNLPDLEVDKFDVAIEEATDDDALYNPTLLSEQVVHPAMVADRLLALLSSGLADYDASSAALRAAHGRPSFWTRYWLPTTLALLSSTTLLRILVNRRAQLVQWVADAGATTLDFYRNWVIDPLRKVIATIRHDAGSEVSIMSRASLEGDRASLERMVVAFAADNNPSADLAAVRAAVREGDLTPVLRAYEADLQSPLLGAVRGNLVRALLIQVQKTKVDVELAMGGIDALLKSQELVFGFVGLTPGLLVSIALFRWVRGVVYPAETGSQNKERREAQLLRTLRNVDRVLARAVPTDFGELYYKDQGLLLCEVSVLRAKAKAVMPDNVYREFGDDVAELADVRSGVTRQREVVERVRWAYGRWF